MLTVNLKDNGVIELAGRFDASQTATATKVFDQVSGPLVVDCEKLEYISSAGLGVLVATYRRLNDQGAGIQLQNTNAHIRNIFHYSGLDKIFEIV